MLNKYNKYKKYKKYKVMKAKLVSENIYSDGKKFDYDKISSKVDTSGNDKMKEPWKVNRGDATLDYNNEKGEVVDIVSYNEDPDEYERVMAEYFDIIEDDDLNGEWAIEVYSKVNGAQVHEPVWYTYGYDGAYVPDVNGIQESMKLKKN